MNKRKSVVRTSIAMNSEDRELINKSGKTVGNFFSDLIGLYRRMSVSNWVEGSYIINSDRFCLINQRNLNQLIVNSKINDNQEIGKIIGKGFRESLVPQDPNITIEGLADHLDKMLRWGKICLQNNNKRIVLRGPIIPKADFNRNFLENFFNIRLEISDSNEFRQVFEVKD